MMALANTLVSTTMRREIRMNPGASILQDVGKDFFGHAPCCGLSSDTVHRLFKLGDVVLTNALIFFGGHDHRNVAVLAANEDGFALGSVEKGREALFGIGGGDRLHLSIIDIIDKLGKSEPWQPRSLARLKCAVLRDDAFFAAISVSWLSSVGRAGRQRLAVERVSIEGFGTEVQVGGAELFGLAQEEVSTRF